MILYTNKLDKIEVDKNIILGSGSYGTAYKHNNKVIKLWNTPYSQDYKNFEILKELSLPNFYKLETLLYRTKESALKQNNPYGYTYKYLEEEDIDILTLPTNYTLDNLYNLYTTIQILTKYNIRNIDLIAENVILNSKIITIIDAELYTKEHNCSPKELLKRNTYDLESLFFDLYKRSLIQYHSYLLSKELNILLYNLFIIHNYKSINNVEKKLTKYKYPLDYLKQHKS